MDETSFEQQNNVLPCRRYGTAWVGRDGRRLCDAWPEDPLAQHLAVPAAHVRLTGGPLPGTVRSVASARLGLAVTVDWGEERLVALVPATQRVRPGDVVHPAFDREHVVLWPLS